MKEKLLKILLLIGIYISIIVSSAILFFNGSLGYFVYILALGDQKGVYVFSAVALLGALLAIIPILFYKNHGKFYYYTLLSTNGLIVFYPLIYKGVASYIFPKVF